MGADIYQAVTDRIIELLEQGTVPWRSPIRSEGGAGEFPTNLLSGRAYRGINIFLLAMSAWAQGYASPYWVTYRQAAERGGHVRKGEKGSLVVFWKQYATKDKESGEDITVPVLRRYTVFNTEQCDDLDVPAPGASDDDAPPFEPIAEAAAIVAGYIDGPRIQAGGPVAVYMPGLDRVRIPEARRFESRESYYATLFHELVHSTGHSKRLDRGLDRELRPFGSPDYSKEELVAEMGSAFLAAAAGISPPTIKQSAAYIDGWRKQLKGDAKLVVQAAGAGQRAADWIRGERPSPGCRSSERV